MRLVISVLFVVMILASISSNAVAQQRIVKPSEPDDRASDTTENYTAMMKQLFAPITASLSLSKEQEFQIIAIISTTQATAEPLIQKFDGIEKELVAASFAEHFDEERVRALSKEQAATLTQLISLKVFAKAKIFQILTADQRKLVSHQFRFKRQTEANLGAISIY
jgi:Spy/CpxP family protein refolding chaperone